ncbi:cingulin-like [Penaeus japonicus]|uniref:cingulin-like n=1 Tax=Penaeus japonicus TaxID=27405 RepID=UPI001C715A91|nr:cingulin-like [Penaeus japonicus]
MATFEGELRRKDHIIEELIKMHPSHGLNKVRGGDAEEALRSDLAAMTVKVERLEQQVRDALAAGSSKDARVTELTRQLDAHRQEHARQAATIVTLRQKLQVGGQKLRLLVGRRSEIGITYPEVRNWGYLESEVRSRGYLWVRNWGYTCGVRGQKLALLVGQRSEIGVTCRSEVRGQKLGLLVGQRSEIGVTCRSEVQRSEVGLLVGQRVKLGLLVGQRSEIGVTCRSEVRDWRYLTHLEEREAAEQRSEHAQKRLVELIRVVTSSLSLGDLDPKDAQEKLSSRLAELVQECARLRGQVLQLDESLQLTEGEAGSARQTVSRLVNELDDEKRTVEEQKLALAEFRKENDDLRTRLRALEEEVKSVRERLHNTNKSYNATLEELHTAEKQLQQAKDESVVSDHRRQQSEVESRGFLTTVAALLSSPEHRVAPEVQAINDRIQSLVASNREAAEHIERLTSQVTSLGEQSRRQSELYETAVKRGRQCEAEVHALTTRGRQLEADAQTAEATREHVVIEKEKTERILNRVIEALGLMEMGQEVTNDVEMIICRCQQLAKLEGEKIVDKTTTVYQLQRKVKSLREAVDRKDLHVDMLRRKLALTEDAARASRHLEEERDELIAK